MRITTAFTLFVLLAHAGAAKAAPALAEAPEALQLDLITCLRLAASHSPELKEAEVALASVREDWNASLSPFYPQLLGSGSEILAGDDLLTNRIEHPLTWSPDTYQAGLSATWNLFNTFRDTLRAKGESKALLQAQAMLRARTQEIGLNASRLYWSLFKQQSLSEVSRQVLSDRRARLDQAQRLFSKGSSSYADLLSTRSQVRDAELSLSAQESAEESSSAQLASLLGKDTHVLLVVSTGTGRVFAAPDEPQSQQWARLHRPEWEAARARVSQASAAHASAWLDNLPTLKVDAAYAKDLARYGRDPVLWLHRDRGDENANWNLTASVNYVFFQGFGVDASVEKSRLEVETARLEERRLRRDLDLEVRLACLALSQDLRAIPLNRDLVEAARLALEETKRRYRSGVAALLEVTESETEYLRARTGQVTALADYQVHLAEWKKAVGQNLLDLGSGEPWE